MLDFSGLGTLTGGSGATGGIETVSASVGCAGVRGTGDAEEGKGIAEGWPLKDDRVGLDRSWLLFRDREGPRLAEEELAVREEIRTGEDSREETAEAVAETEADVVVEGLGSSFGTWPKA
jgi:hypothetical protein